MNELELRTQIEKLCLEYILENKLKSFELSVDTSFFTSKNYEKVTSVDINIKTR